MIDVGSANARANELRGYASNLREASRLLEQYQTDIQSNWQAQEVIFYISAINNAQKRLSSAASELESIASSVSSTASQIRAEEEAAERARQEAERRRREEEERQRQEAEAEAERQRQAAIASTSAVVNSVKKTISKYTNLK